MKRLAVISTHPIQYYAPLFKLLNQQKNIEIKVFYTLGEAGLQAFDPGFGKKIIWDIPLLEGYPYQFQKNTAKKPGSDYFLGVKNPDLTVEIERWKADFILVFGWAYYSHLQALVYFKNKIPVFFRGDSTLLNKENRLKNSIKNVFLSWVYRHVDHAFYVGTKNKAYFKKFGLREKQLSFSPHSIDNQRFSANHSSASADFRMKLGIKPDEILILFSGKFKPVKNPLLLLEAFESLRQHNTHLLFVGNGPLERDLKEKKSTLKTASRIHFEDFQNQLAMPAIYKSCDLFCLPSKSETWGLAVNEAMACGKAVLVSDRVGCAVDLVKPGLNGEIFESQNLGELVKKLRLLTKNKEQLTKYALASKEIIARWGFENTARSIAEKVLKW